MKSTSQKENSSPPLTADPSLIEILMELHPYLAEDRVIPIALEATRKKERLSSTPFYANRAKDYPRNSNQKCENAYWIHLAINYQGTG